MKKFNKVSLIVVMLIVVALCAMTIVACDHQHNYSEWGNDADGHWKYCPDDESIDESSKAPHSFGSDGKCECGYEKPAETPGDHSHSYDANGDCSCGDHQHVWASDYDHDNNGHWIACIKNGCDGKKEEGSHSYDADGDCVCGLHQHSYDASGDCACGDHQHVYALSDIELPSYDRIYDEDLEDYVSDPITREYVQVLIDGSAHIECAKADCISKDIVLKLMPFATEVSKSDVESEEYYCVFPEYNVYLGMPEGLIFSSGDSTSIEMIYMKDDVNFEWNNYQQAIPDGQFSFEGMYGAIMMISSSDGNLSFEVNALPGKDSSNPLSISKDQQASGSISGSLWFSYEAESTGKIVIINSTAANDISLYIDGSMCLGEYNICNVTEGTKYSLKLVGDGSYDIKIVDYSSSYSGYSYTDPIELSGDSYSATNAAGNRYYKYVATSAGRPAISIDTPGVSYTLHYIDSEYGYFYEHYNVPRLEEGDELYIVVSSGDIASYGLSINVSDTNAFDHTFTVKDNNGSPLSGITVSVNGKSGETDADGQVVLNFIPGEYEISLSGYDDTQLAYSATSTDGDSQSYEIRLGAILSNKFTVKDGDGNPVSGVKVVLKQGQNASGAVGAYGTTDADGIVTIKYVRTTTRMYVDIESDSYEVSSLSAQGLDSGQRYFAVSSFAGVDMELTLNAKSSEPEPQGNVLAMGNNSISVAFDEYDSPIIEEYTFTSAEGGDYVLSFDKSQYQYVDVIIGKFNSVLYYYLSQDEGYEDEYQDSYEFHLDPGESITFRMSTQSYEPDQYVLKLAYATAESLSIGDNLVAASWTGETITFTSEEGGKFILSTLDRNAAIYLDIDDEEPICGLGANYSFTLEANGSITFYMCTQYPSVEGTQYIVNIAVDNSPSEGEGEGGSDDGGSGSPSSNQLILSTNTINAANDSDGAFISQSYVFTSEAGGTYTISSEDSDFAFHDSKKDEDHWEEFTFTLGAGESITFNFGVGTAWGEATKTYDVTISEAAE